MKKKIKFGASLYYASDKNIFDALTRSRVNAETMQDLFLRRNIIVSTKTDREDLASTSAYYHMISSTIEVFPLD